MSYQVNLGSDILYFPGAEDAEIYDAELNEEIGVAGEFRFKVPPVNPVYNSLTTGALVTILRDNKEYWRGEIRDIQTDFNKVASVYCLEDLAWLADEFIAPASITNETYAQRFQAAITAYNANRTAERQFAAGNITNVTSSNMCNWRTEYEWSILTSLRECIGSAGSDTGYIRVRRVTSGGVVTRYIDIVKLSDYGVAATQPIEYGYNLLNYVKKSDYSNLTNVLTPYGAELDSEVYTEYNARLQGTTITNAASVSVYGRHAKAVVFDGVTDGTALDNLASSYLSRYCQPQLTMEVSAVDLADIENVNSINIGDSVRIIAEPFAVDQTLYLTQIRRDIQNIDKNTITLSGHVHTGRTLTSQVNSAAEALADMPSEFSILDSAKKNALSLLLSETQSGYVVFEYDADNTQMVAINICDAQTIDASTKRWRWSQGGFGYMYRTATTDPWTGPSVAMTMNGEIVANFITTGTLNADLVTVNGKIEATSGYIGNATNGWQIGSTNIHNGPTSISDTTEGMYVGTDGIRTNGATSQWTRISGGMVDSNQLMTAYGFYVRGSNKAYMSGATVAGEHATLAGTSGANGTLTFPANTSGSVYCYLTVEDGIVTAIGTTP